MFLLLKFQISKKQVIMRFISISTYNGHIKLKFVLDFFINCVRDYKNCVREKNFWLNYG